jgi:hypothetical protein
MIKEVVAAALLFFSSFFTISTRSHMKRIALILFFAALFLAACAGVQVRSAFDNTLTKYNDLVRWNRIDQAALFAAPSIASEFGKRAEAARNARIFDYQVIDVKYNEKTREASAFVVYSYYTYTSAEVKKVTDNQKWVYTSEDGVKGWRLKSLPPEFR